jgi:hypothetical protein
MLTPGEAETIKQWLDTAKVSVDDARTAANQATNYLGRLIPAFRDSVSDSAINAADAAQALWDGLQAKFLEYLTTPDDEHEEAIVLVEMAKRLANRGTANSINDLAQAMSPAGFTGNVAKGVQDTLNKWLSGFAVTMHKLFVYGAIGAVLYLLITFSPELKAAAKLGRKRK